MSISREKLGEIYATAWLRHIYTPLALRPNNDADSKHDTGDFLNDCFLTLISQNLPPPTYEELNEFKRRVVNWFVENYWRNDLLTSTDYAPKGLLSTWLDGLKIRRHLPTKFIIMIYFNQNGELSISEDSSPTLLYHPCEEVPDDIKQDQLRQELDDYLSLVSLPEPKKEAIYRLFESKLKEIYDEFDMIKAYAEIVAAGRVATTPLSLANALPQTLFNLAKQEAVNEYEPLCKAFQDAANAYKRQYLSRRFTCFYNHEYSQPQRRAALEKITNACERFKNSNFTDSDEFFKDILEIREAVQNNHEEGSIWGWLGITSSNLVKEIDAALHTCIVDGRYITLDHLSGLKGSVLAS